MALGGGTWTTQNKSLPGAYINFSNLNLATPALSDRGIAAVPLACDWGPEGEIFAVTAEDLQKNSRSIFGYDYTADEMLYVREVFRHATLVYFWRLGSGSVKAANTYAEARYGGTRGNALKLVISQNVDDASRWDVETYLGSERIDLQIVGDASQLEDNDFVVFKKTGTLSETAGLAFADGANSEINNAAHQAFLTAVEGYSFNALCCPSADATIVALYSAFTRRLRDEVGAKFQLVAWQAEADYEGVIGVWTASAGTDTHALVYWLTGAEAGVGVNESLTNAPYDGELELQTAATQSELAAAIKAGKLLIHLVNGSPRVLSDINSLTTVTPSKGNAFKSNQTVRVCDQIANDTAVLFNTTYVGRVQNNADGRAALWNDVVMLLHTLENIGAVEDFDEGSVTVELGDERNTVLLNVSSLSVVGAMEQLYMSVVIR